MATGAVKKKASSTSQRHNAEHVVVMCRIRPFTDDERRLGEAESLRKISMANFVLKEKQYEFDKVFGPDTSQVEIYADTISALMSDLLSGYNCCVFAYGSTGTGKTFTMTGSPPGHTDAWLTHHDAGLIPRAVTNVLERLRTMTESGDFCMKISYLEIYNEDIRDLLTGSTEPLQVYNDHKGNVCIKGLQEMLVENRVDLHRLLKRGIENRQTCATNLNNRSSRSHAVFIIYVNRRIITADGEEIIKNAKLYLVDLAGSENIIKSGSKERTEVGNINKSLLTLNRIIQLLSDSRTYQHIPFRESKLTRILQDSLGGKTKTYFIATISPLAKHAEESQSTLEYACRARHITNTPQVNINKSTHVIKELESKILSLEKQLDATRLGVGYYIVKETHEKLLEELEKLRNESTKYKEQITDLSKENMVLARHARGYHWNKSILKDNKKTLEQKTFIIKELENYNDFVVQEVECLVQAAESYSDNNVELHDKLSKLHQGAAVNEVIVKESQEKLSKCLTDSYDARDDFKRQHGEYMGYAQQHVVALKNEVELNTTEWQEQAVRIKRLEIPINHEAIKNVGEFLGNMQTITQEYKQTNSQKSQTATDNFKMAVMKLNENAQEIKKMKQKIKISTTELMQFVDRYEKEAINEQERCQEEIANIIHQHFEQSRLMAKRRSDDLRQKLENMLTTQTDMLGKISEKQNKIADKHLNIIRMDYNSRECEDHNLILRLESEIHNGHNATDVLTTAINEVNNQRTTALNQLVKRTEIYAQDVKEGLEQTAEAIKGNLNQLQKVAEVNTEQMDNVNQRLNDVVAKTHTLAPLTLEQLPHRVSVDFPRMIPMRRSPRELQEMFDVYWEEHPALSLGDITFEEEKENGCNGANTSSSPRCDKGEPGPSARLVLSPIQNFSR